MRYLLLFILLFSVVLTVALPQGTSAKGTLLELQEDYCARFVVKNVTLSPVPIRYTFEGTCDLAHTRLALPVTAPYTVVGTYDPTTGKTTEDMNVPAPAINQPSRPYGRFFSSMHCNADPWRDPNAKCDQVAWSVNPPGSAYPPNDYGNYVRSFISSLSGYSRPYTSYMVDDQRKAFNAQYEASLAADRKAQQVLQAAKQPSGAYSAQLHPTVLAPTAGQFFPAQRPVPIKLAPPKGWNVSNYMITIERKDVKGNWIAHATIPVGAAQAQSAAGYTGFGNGAPPAFLTVPGRYRLNAQASYPNKSGVSDWVEFTATEYFQDSTTLKNQRSPFLDAIQKK